MRLELHSDDGCLSCRGSGFRYSERKEEYVLCWCVRHRSDDEIPDHEAFEEEIAS